MVHSTAPVFGGGGNWVGERRLPVWKSQEEGVVLVVLNSGELSVDDASTFVQVLRYYHVHVTERKKVVEVILQGYCGNRCFLLERACYDDAVDTVGCGFGDS